MCLSRNLDLHLHLVMRSEHLPIRRLSHLLVLYHLVLKPNQALLHRVVSVPVFKHAELRRFNGSIALVDTRQINLAVELYLWWHGGILLTAHNAHHVDPVVEVGVLWADDGAVPVREGLVVALVEAI